MLAERNITDFLNTEYLEYSRYTVEDRAIPSLCDGFKPGARKIMHAANEGTIKDGKTYKLLVLSGDTLNKSQYSHGDMSLNATIAEKSKDFVNNLNALEIEGQSGSLRNPDAVGSPRYLYIRKSKYMDAVYKTDYDLLEYVFDEGMYLEPKQYLPIMPTILTSMAMGIANGYSFHTMAYNPINIIDCCLNILKKGKSSMIRPFLRGISNDTWKYEDGHWFSYGKWKFNQSKDIMTITDLPCDVTYEDFEKLLNKYIEKGYIKDFNNLSQDGNIHYEIQFPTKQLSIELKKEAANPYPLSNKFRLIKQVPDDLLWVLDENHKLKHFDTPYDLIHYFVNWRLSIYTERKKRLVKILEERYKNNCDLVRFIELVCNGKLKIRNRSKADIKVDMDGYKLPMMLLSTPMSKCTIEERDELLKQNEEIKKELEYIKNTSEKQMYINDLTALRKVLEKDFPGGEPTEETVLTVAIEGSAKKTKEDRELDKLKAEKEKQKKAKEKERAAKEREKQKKAKEKEKAAKEREKAAKEKVKANAAKEKQKKEKAKAAKEKQKAKIEKEKAKLKNKKE